MDLTFAYYSINPWNMRITTAISALSSLAHEGRLRLFRLLVQAGEEGLPVGELASRADINFTTASAQLQLLARSGLVRNQREGRSIRYLADFDQLRGLIAWLMQDCCGGRSEILAPLQELAGACCRSDGTGDTP